MLNKGLKFTPKPTTVPLLETVVDIETILKFKVPSIQHDIRSVASEAINIAKQSTYTSELAKQQKTTIEKLKEKDVVYVKADKSNQIVILNKNDYEQRVEQTINECGYKKVNKNPLKKMIRQVDQIRQKISKIFSARVCRSLIVSNPKMPKMYALPKTHIQGNKMRPIVSNIDAPCYKLAKWLVKEVKKLPKLDSFSVKNSFEFVEKMKDVIMEKDEIMISFDVSSLFPRIPVNIALLELEKYLNNLN